VKRTVAIFAVLTAVLSAACVEEGVDELNSGSKDGKDTSASSDPASNDPSKTGQLQCTAGPAGRSYAAFDGSKLEASRLNENFGVNRARVKPYGSLEKEYQRVLGVVPPSIKNAGGSFDIPAARWFGEPQYSGVSLHALATISYEACLAYTKGKPAFAAAPTEETAKTECTNLMRKAWSRSPSPEEISGCSNLATKALAEEKDVNRRWAYTCASVLSASQFLTF